MKAAKRGFPLAMKGTENSLFPGNIFSLLPAGNCITNDPLSSNRIRFAGQTSHEKINYVRIIGKVSKIC